MFYAYTLKKSNKGRQKDKKEKEGEKREREEEEKEKRKEEWKRMKYLRTKKSTNRKLYINR